MMLAVTHGTIIKSEPSAAGPIWKGGAKRTLLRRGRGRRTRSRLSARSARTRAPPAPARPSARGFGAAVEQIRPHKTFHLFQELANVQRFFSLHFYAFLMLPPTTGRLFMRLPVFCSLIPPARARMERNLEATRLNKTLPGCASRPPHRPRSASPAPAGGPPALPL